MSYIFPRRDPLAQLEAVIAGEPTEPNWCHLCGRHRTRDPDELCPICEGLLLEQDTEARTRMGWNPT